MTQSSEAGGKTTRANILDKWPSSGLNEKSKRP